MRTRPILGMLLLCALPSAASAEIVLTTWNSFLATPRLSFQGSPLNYIFEATVGVLVTDYDTVQDGDELLALNGAIENRQTFLGFFHHWTNVMACGQAGFVNEVSMQCYMGGRILCPAADGLWRSKNKTLYGRPPRTRASVTAPYRAQCLTPDGPPGPCGLVEAASTTTMDLLTGEVRRARADAGDLPVLRQAQKDGMSYTFERWSLHRPGSPAALGAHLGSRISGREVLLARQPRGRVLRVDAPPLPDGHVTTPAVRYDVHNSVRMRPREKVLVRVEFAPSGATDEVQTLVGSPALGDRLGEELSLETRSAEHRTVVYALFDGRGRAETPRLLSTISVLPRCCCGSLLCQ